MTTPLINIRMSNAGSSRIKSLILSTAPIGKLTNTLKTNLGKTLEDLDLEMIDALNIVGYDLLWGGKDDVKVEYFYSNRAKLDTFLM